MGLAAPAEHPESAKTSLKSPRGDTLARGLCRCRTAAAPQLATRRARGSLGPPRGGAAAVRPVPRHIARWRSGSMRRDGCGAEARRGRCLLLVVGSKSRRGGRSFARWPGGSESARVRLHTPSEAVRGGFKLPGRRRAGLISRPCLAPRRRPAGDRPGPRWPASAVPLAERYIHLLGTGVRVTDLYSSHSDGQGTVGQCRVPT